MRCHGRSGGAVFLRRTSVAIGAFGVAAVILAGPCLQVVRAETQKTYQTDAPAMPATAVRTEIVASGLEHPWALQFLPDGRFLVTERPGRIRIVTRAGRLSKPLPGVPDVAATGQGGLLDVALAPDFTSTGVIYFTFSEARGGVRTNGTSLARARLSLAPGRERLEDVAVIFRQEPAGRSGLHFGSRIVFDRGGRVFVTLGERYQMQFAQDLGRHWGKIVRLERDGRPADGNPFAGQVGAKPEIWSYGHRNAQGAAFNPASGQLWVVEHGPRGG
ncbi:MAG: PQQ-dependent sugar dehydrogenase, partial [Hyphomicrobiaceae bacterium]